MKTKEVKLYVPIENIGLENAPEVYKKDGLNPYIQFIRDQVSGEAPDLSSKKGRDRIASLAAQVSRSKSAIEKPGRDYLKHLKSLPKVVETELREFVNACDALRDETRKPLSEWEDAETDRVDRHKLRIEHIKSYLDECHLAMSTLLINNYIHELEELRRKEAEREQKERDDRIAREAVESARKAAEAETQRQREEDQRKANEEKLAAERREMQLKLEAENAEKRRLEAEQRHLDDLKAAELRAKQEAENERKAIEAQQAAEKAAADKLAANKAHRTKINREILSFLKNAGLTEDQAKTVITLAAKFKAGRLTIDY